MDPMATSRTSSSQAPAASGSEKREVRIDFKLVPVGQPPRLVSSVTLKEVGSDEGVLSKALEQETSLVAEALLKLE
jgi:hypothetical protein